MDGFNSPGLLSQVLDASDDQVYVIDTDRWRVIDCNEGACRALGYPKETLVGMKLARFDANLWRGAALDDALRTQQPGDRAVSFRTRHRRQDGSTFPAEVSARTAMLDGARVQIAIARDITAQRQLERELAESRRQFETLVRNLPGVVYRCELTDPVRILWLDERIVELTGRPAGDYLNGKIIFGADVAPEDYRRVQAAFTEIAERGSGNLDLTYTIITASGDRRLVRDSATVTASALPGGVPTIEGITVDITETADQERVLREAWQAEHARYEFVVAASGQIVYEWDIAQGTVSWGGSLKDVLGYEEQQHGHAIQDALDRIHPEDRGPIVRQTVEAMKQATNFDQEYRYRHADGTYRWVWDHAVFEPGPDGKMARATGVLQDITARKRLEAQVNSAQRMETIGALAGGVAHDVNNYLTAILGNVDLALMRMSDPAAWPELQDAHDAAAGCGELVRSLLTFARQQGPSRSMLNLGAVVRDAVRMLRPLLGAEVALSTRIENACPAFEADRVQVQQVIMNLVTNANDAMGGRGAVTIGAASIAAVHPESGVHGEFAQLWVEDSGPGIPPELRLKIFEPYFTTRPFGGGTGLGLSIVHGIAHAHGGWVEVSPTHPGARVSVYFPVGKAEV